MKRLRHLTVGGINQVLYTKNNRGVVDNDSYVIIDLKKDLHLVDPREFIDNIDNVKYSFSMRYSEFKRFVVGLVKELATIDDEANKLVMGDSAPDPNGRTGPLSS